jgi:hypothetical protein
VTGADGEATVVEGAAVVTGVDTGVLLGVVVVGTVAAADDGGEVTETVVVVTSALPGCVPVLEHPIATMATALISQ